MDTTLRDDEKGGKIDSCRYTVSLFFRSHYYPPGQQRRGRLIKTDDQTLESIPDMVKHNPLVFRVTHSNNDTTTKSQILAAVRSSN